MGSFLKILVDFFFCGCYRAGGEAQGVDIGKRLDLREKGEIKGEERGFG